MPTIIIFLLLTLVLVLGGKFIFPFIGAVILGLYHGIVDVTFNLLLAIYAIIPGHDLGIALIILTVIVRLAMWPLIKKQLHQTKVMRKLQPELKKVKAKAKGDKQLEARLMMELYREKGVSPFGSIGVLILQLPILLALYQVIRLIAQDTNNVISHSYSFIRDFGYMSEVTADIGNFSEKLFGSIDLTTTATADGRFYVPLFIMAVLAAVFQYFQSKQLLPHSEEKKTIRELFRDASKGKQADQSDVSAAMGGSMVKIFPIITFVFAISIQGALTLYLLTTALVGWAQQTYILSQDVEEMENLASKKGSAKKEKETASQTKRDKRVKEAKEATVVTEPKKPRAAAKKKSKKGKK